jgi:hypothetical protein
MSVVLHICNHSYLGGGGLEELDPALAPGKTKTLLKSKKAGGMAQVVQTPGLSKPNQKKEMLDINK